MPTSLRSTLYNDYKNDGAAAMHYLRSAFDSNDSNDYAAQLANLQKSKIDPKHDLSEDDVREQYTRMTTAIQAIRRTGQPPPDDAVERF